MRVIAKRGAAWQSGAYCLLLIAALLAPQAMAVSLGEVHGKITGSAGKAIAGARVTLVEQTSGSRRIAYTDINGNYLLSNLSPARYSLEVFHDGYAQSVPVTFEGSVPDTELDFELQPIGHLFGLPSADSFSYLFVTALVPALVLLFFTRPFQVLTFKLWQLVQTTTYKILAPSFPNRIGIPGYKNRLLRSDLAYIENLVGPPELKVQLEKAFAPITVVSESAKSGIDPFAFAASHARFIMLGGPGTGKTTLMKSLVTNIVKGTISDELKGMVPVFIVLRELARAQHSVQQAVLASLTKFGLPRSETFVEAALSKGRLLIVLDGLDEVGANRPSVTDAIRAFCQTDDTRDQPHRLVVTCREMSYRIRDLNDVIPVVARVDPFTPQHMRVFLKGWPTYRDRVALRLYGELEKSPSVRESCRNPLLLSILAGLYLQTADFDLPSSRDEFYQTAINELLVNRPARRGFKQEFPERDKWLLLQRLSLHALQVSSPGHDEETLTRADLYGHAKAVFGNAHSQSSFRRLLNELVEVNGILKYVEEDSFTLGHRTFQEYLAAREARRTLSVDDVLTKFADRLELYEVISFYAGLITNIPQLNQLLRNLLKRSKEQLAGRCLLSAAEVPDPEVVERVVGTLFNSAKAQLALEGNHLIDLEIISFLSQKSNAAFDPARARLSELIELLRESSAAKSSASIVSILATREETAFKLIPGLLGSDSKDWRIAGVNLLFGLGTDSSLDSLVQLLVSEDPIVKHEAAVLVSGLVERRPGDLVARAELLPARVDLKKWPLEKYIPGRLALPILEGLSIREEGTVGEIADSGSVMETVSRAITGTIDKDWRNLRRDIKVRDSLTNMGWVILLVLAIFGLVFNITVLAFSIKTLSPSQAEVVSFHPFEIHAYQGPNPKSSVFAWPSLKFEDPKGHASGILIRRPNRLVESFIAFYAPFLPLSALFFYRMQRKHRQLWRKTWTAMQFTNLAPFVRIRSSPVARYQELNLRMSAIYPACMCLVYFPALDRGVVPLAVCLVFLCLFIFGPRVLLVRKNKYFEVADATRRLVYEGANSMD